MNLKEEMERLAELVAKRALEKMRPQELGDVVDQKIIIFREHPRVKAALNTERHAGPMAAA